jgi:hypothetical protein
MIADPLDISLSLFFDLVFFDLHWGRHERRELKWKRRPAKNAMDRASGS